MALGLGALVLFSRDLEWKPFLASWKEIHLGWYGLGIFFFCFSFSLRCPRWKVLVEDLGEVSFGLLTKAFFVGMLVNRIFPARLGEIARCVVLKQRAGLSFVGLLATVAVEKSFDGLALLSVAALSLGLLPAGELPESLRPLFEANRTRILLGALSLPLLLLLTAWVLPWILERFGIRKDPHDKRNLFGTLVWAGLSGLASLRQGKKSLAVICWTTLVWLTLVFSAYCALKSFGFGLPFSAGVVLCAAIGISVVIPQAPSYIGVYQLAVEWSLVSIYDVPQQQAKAFAVAIWALQIIPVGLIGLTCLRSLGSSLAQATRVEEAAE